MLDMILEKGKDYYINPGEKGTITFRDEVTKEYLCSTTLNNTSDRRIRVIFTPMSEVNPE